MTPITVSVASATSLIGCGKTKIYQLINDRTLDTVRIGRRRFVRTDSIERMLSAAAVR